MFRDSFGTELSSWLASNSACTFTNRFATFAVPAASPSRFYRANEFESDPPVLNWGGGEWPKPLLVYGKPKNKYALEMAVSLSGKIAWTEVSTFLMTNSWRWISLNSLPDPKAFFRIRDISRQPPKLGAQLRQGGEIDFVLEGVPGVRYSIEGRNDLGTNATWLPVLSVVLTNGTQTIRWTNLGKPMYFFRAVEATTISQPFLLIERADGAVLTMRLEGVAGAEYAIETTQDRQQPHRWVPVLNLTLTNAWRSFDWTNAGEGLRLFRASLKE